MARFSKMEILKETRCSYFCVTPKNFRLMSYENIKKYCHRKSNCMFLQLRRRKLFKSSSFCNISNFNNGFVWNPSNFKGQFLNELRVSFKQFRYYSLKEIKYSIISIFKFYFYLSIFKYYKLLKPYLTSFSFWRFLNKSANSADVCCIKEV